MLLINIFQLVLEISGVIFWMCIIFCAIWLPFAIKNAGEAPDEKIYRDKFNNSK
jgi:amino acid permease